MFTFASCTQEQLQSVVREANRKMIAVTKAGHQPDGQVRQEMVHHAPGREQRCSVLNKPGFKPLVRQAYSIIRARFICQYD